MSSFAKISIGLVSTVIIFVISYFVFRTDRVFDIILPKSDGAAPVREAVMGARDKVYGQINEWLAPIRNKANETVEGAIEAAGREVDGVFSKAKEGAAESIKKSFNEKIDAFSGKSAEPMTGGSYSGAVSFSGGAAGNSATANLVDNFPLGFSVKKGLPTIFIVKSSAEAKTGFSYSVTWGDGKKDVGEVAPMGATTVYHIWDKEGEYNIKIETRVGEISRNYLSYILVY